MKKKDNKKLKRSANWYGKIDKDGFIHRSWMKNQGLPDKLFDGRSVIGICNTWSEFTPCNSNLRKIAEKVKNGIWEAGGLPVEFPVMSLGETQIKPTAMLFRNLLAMDVEESIRGYGMDGVVLLGGCDKTTPALLMGAASVDLPTIVVSAGPMLNGKWRGQDIGSGTDVWKFSEQVRAEKMTVKEFMSAEAAMSRSAGVCMTMGTASSMAALTEAMGLCLPYNATLPAVDARRMSLAHLSGNRIVKMVDEGLILSKVLSKNSFINAIIANAAIGGSTNVVLHLLAIAGRAGIKLCLDDFNVGSNIPLLLNCMPSGQYLMEDFDYAGGMPALLKEIKAHLKPANSILAKDIKYYTHAAECFNRNVIYKYDKPLRKAAGIKVLKGNLAPNGAVIKPSAASPELLEHEGKAVVFENIEDLKNNIDRDDLAVDKNSILVLKGCGPKGYPGMPEVGNMPIPAKLLKQGVKDMVRISDARMSGTAFGTVVLHISPESEAGGTLGIVQTGDIIQISVKQQSINLKISPVEIKKRIAARKITLPDYKRGYVKIYIDHVMQAETGADLDFLIGKDTRLVKRESH